MRPTRAFTLVELMAALAVVGLLAFLATSSWSAYWQRAHRVSAGAALVGALSQLELRRARTGTYDGESPFHGPIPHADGYSIRPQACSSAGIELPKTQCIEVVAVPDRADASCGMLVLRSTGEREPRDAACWP
ncbi:hypothetical protein C0Q88_05895 [Ralstonia pickettii]|uniref:Uncharacterized protein n=1 Tax=Ralstonia pickettii TaxID=329 RepID=A0A2N4TWZ6_RALPI|nr:hypothetical protein C0Q88_05895 [Ralstonia pickettii]